MYKNSYKNLQWLGKSIDYFAHSKAPHRNDTDIIRKLKKGDRYKAIVDNFDATHTAHFRIDQTNIKGKSVLPKFKILHSNDHIIIEVEEIGYKNNAIFLTAKYIRNLCYNRKEFVCKKCQQEFTKSDEYYNHIEYSCGTSICRYCREKYPSKDEFKHLDGKCQQRSVTERARGDKSPGLKKCPHCGCLLKSSKYEKHILQKCPKVPRGETPIFQTLNPTDNNPSKIPSNRHVQASEPRSNSASDQIKPEQKAAAIVSLTYKHPLNILNATSPKPVLKPVIVEHLTDVLSSRFANGFRLNSPIEMARFRSFVKNDVNEEPSLSDEELKGYIAACGMTFDGKVYAVPSLVKERIKQLADDYFADGAKAIFFAEFYSKNEKWLFDASVVSEDILVKIFLKLFPKLLFTQTYFGYTDASIFAVLEDEILRVWGDNLLRTYSQLAERLRYIPLERIKFSLGQNGDFIWNSVETFSHISRIEISDEERRVIRDAALRECNSRGYASIADLPFGGIEERNYGLSPTAVHKMVYRICLSDKFDIKGKIFTRKGNTLDALTIMKNYCRTIEKCSLDDLLNYEKELTGEVHRWLPMEAGNTILVRINKDTYVADKFVHFDVEVIDTVIELFIEGDYLPLHSFTTFGPFPCCGQGWNLFLLESYCRRFSRKFRFDAPSVNSRNVGAVIRKNCSMEYTDIMTDAVANADIPLKETAVGKFLYERGFTGRSTTAKVDEIIDKAKGIRERKD